MFKSRVLKGGFPVQGRRQALETFPDVGFARRERNPDAGIVTESGAWHDREPVIFDEPVAELIDGIDRASGKCAAEKRRNIGKGS